MNTEIDKAINDIQDYVKLLYLDYSKGMSKINEIVGIVQTYIGNFVSKIETYNKFGENIAVDIVLDQIKRLSDGISFGDQVQIADILQYEIIESLKIYGELVEKYGQI